MEHKQAFDSPVLSQGQVTYLIAWLPRYRHVWCGSLVWSLQRSFMQLMHDVQVMIESV
jgi:hypothetical protein